MNEPEGRRDLAPLDLRGDPSRWERVVQEINRANAPELARRAAQHQPGVLLFLSEWRRPAAAACTAIAASAAAILLLQIPASSSPASGVASALGYPDAVAAWVESGEGLSVEELLFAMEGRE